MLNQEAGWKSRQRGRRGRTGRAVVWSGASGVGRGHRGGPPARPARYCSGPTQCTPRRCAV